MRVHARIRLTGLLLVAVVGLLPRPAVAAWPTDPLVNVPLCTAVDFQWRPTVVPDGAGGAIITWYDNRTGASDVYAQRVSADGVLLWTPDGVPLCTAASSQFMPSITADGAGGAIVAWQDRRGGEYSDIYAQRVSAAGFPQWTADGVALCTAFDDQLSCTIVADGAGGAIVTWQDHRSVLVVGNDIYAQRISAGGVPQWTANGAPLCTALGEQTEPRIAADGESGAIVTWEDQRSGSGFGSAEIYAQRISAGGAVQWTPNGVALCTALYDQSNPDIVPDGAGGAIVAWADMRSQAFDIYAQRVSAAGAVLWAPNGMALCTAAGEQAGVAMASDDAGGAILTWVDGRGLGSHDIYAQRVSAAGLFQWTADGVALCDAAAEQTFPTIVADGRSGAIVTWFDQRTGSGDVYAQRVTSGGKPRWGADGVAVCLAAGSQLWPALASDGESGAIVAWEDGRNGTNDIYAQRVLADGYLGGGSVDVPGDASLALALDPMRPNPSRGGPLTVQFTLASAGAASIELFDVAGRRMAAREVSSLGVGRHALDLREGRRLAPGLYLVALRQGTSVRVTRVVVLD